jgi:hypothetical protein
MMTGSTSRRRSRAAILALIALTAAACSAKTDRESYAPGQGGTATFSNGSSAPGVRGWVQLVRDCDAMCGGADCPGMCVAPLRSDAAGS